MIICFLYFQIILNRPIILLKIIHLTDKHIKKNYYLMDHQFHSDLCYSEKIFGFSALKFGSYYRPFIVLKKSDKE